jgi:hypothetical protein
MKTILISIALATFTLSASVSADKKNSPEKIPMESLEGITHYGMPIQETTKTYHQKESVLKVVYSKMLSDDNMDDYVKRLYDELLRQIEKWLYANELPSKDMRIVISNCKFCKIGYCKRKNVKEVSLVLYINDTSSKHIAFKHNDIIDKNTYIDMARSAVILFLDR